MDEEGLEVYLADLRNQAENPRLLAAFVEAALARKHENKMVAESTEAWLMTFRKTSRTSSASRTEARPGEPKSPS